MRDALLLWTHRLTCGGCGRSSRATTGAGDMIATPEGWRCAACVGETATPPSDLAGEPETGADICG